MTQREFFELIIAEFDNEEAKEHARKQIEKLDARNRASYQRDKRDKKSFEKEALDVGKTILGDARISAAELGELKGVNSQKAASWLRKLVELGELEEIPGTRPKRYSRR